MSGGVDGTFEALVADLLAPLGRVDSRRMFGARGLYHDGVMFGILAGEELYFRVDRHSVERFRAAGSSAFTYRSGAKTIALPYWSAPADLFDDEDALVDWARQAIAASIRARHARGGVSGHRSAEGD